MIMGNFRCIVAGLLAQASISFILGTSHASAFISCPTTINRVPSTTSLPSRSRLYAKKKQKPKKKGQNASTSGFGGAATTPCPCGSELGYMKCCGKLHKDAKAYTMATAEQVVRARYSAYAKREVDFIVGLTHPLNKNFMSDIEHWKETIKMNCYDNFLLTSCEIIEESYEGEGETEIAKVKFVAQMTQVDSKEKTAFMETSLFERAGKHIANGAWLYKEGIIETAPGMPEPKEEEDESEDEKAEEGEQVEMANSGAEKE